MKVGILGTGNMGKAIIKGYIKNAKDFERIYVYDINEGALKDVSKMENVVICKSIKDLLSHVEIVILAIKPNIFEIVLKEINELIDNNKIIVSIAAGITIKYMEDRIGTNAKIVRVMPNTPAMVGESMSTVTPNINVMPGELMSISDIFSSIGKVEIIEEKMIDAVIGVSGSSPAYVYMFIEALADGAVLQGMPRDKAYKFAAQAVLGSAKMVLESGKHPGELKDMVCSPGGTTISAVHSLEKNGFRNAVMDAVVIASEKSRKMSKENG